MDSFEQLAGADARKVILFLAVMAVHAVGEGGGVGVSFAGDRGWAQVREGQGRTMTQWGYRQPGRHAHLLFLR